MATLSPASATQPTKPTSTSTPAPTSTPTPIAAHLLVPEIFTYCASCTSVLQNLFSTYKNWGRKTMLKKESAAIKAHTRTLHEVFKGMHAQCPFCWMLGRALDPHNNDRIRRKVKNGTWSPDHLVSFKGDASHYVGNEGDEHRGAKLQYFTVSIGVKDGQSEDAGTITLQAVKDSPPMKTGDIRLYFRTPRDEEALLKIIGIYLENCEENSNRRHDQCKFSRALGCVIDDEELVPLPHRVLNIEGDVPILEDTRNTEKTRGSYAILSYCWGTVPQLTTVKRNLEEHSKGFVIESISKTVRDAIRIAKILGFSRLWVDALCIIQDDPEDWKVEASMMARYYGAAKLTLAVSRASGAHDGCFNNRPLEHIAVLPYYNSEGKRDGHFYARQTVSFGKSVLGSEYISRAWVVQERMLSRRILYIAKGSFFFWCRDHRSWETTVAGEDSSRWNLSGESWKGMSSLGNWETSRITGILPVYTGKWKDSQMSSNRDRIEDSIFPHWLKIADIYSATKLTVQGDKVVAIKGLMQAYADALKHNAYEESEANWKVAMENIATLGARSFNRPIVYKVATNYTYGIWLVDLGRQLLWRRDTAHPLERSEIDAPSWSWMALKSPITYPKFVPRSYPTDATVELVKPVTLEQIPTPKLDLRHTIVRQIGFLGPWGELRKGLKGQDEPGLQDANSTTLSTLDPFSVKLSDLPEHKLSAAPIENQLDNAKELILAGHLSTVYKYPIDPPAERDWEGLTTYLQEWITVWDLARAPNTGELRAYHPIWDGVLHKMWIPRDGRYKKMCGWGCFEEEETEESFKEPLHALYVSTNEAELQHKKDYERSQGYGYLPWTYTVEVREGKGAMWNVLFLRAVDGRPKTYRRVGMGQITEKMWIEQFKKKTMSQIVLV